MNFRSSEYIKQYNEQLSEHGDWKVELYVHECGEDAEFRVFRFHTDKKRYFLMGYIPIDTPISALISCVPLCKHYFRWGQLVAISGLASPSGEVSSVFIFT